MKEPSPLSQRGDMVFKNIDLDENIILKNRIPILVMDQNWLKLFGDIKYKNLQYLKEELNELIKKEGKLKEKYYAFQREKTHAMKMILGISDAINNESKDIDPKLLDEYKSKIEKANEELEEITFQLETIPQEIREVNFQLLEITVDYGYKELKTREKKLNETVEELDKLRERLRELINKKHDYEEWIDSTYSFLHGMLGSKEMEKLDEEILDKGDFLW